MQQIRYVQHDKDIDTCWQAVQALRPHLQYATYVQQVKEMQQEGYQMLFIAGEVDGQETAVAFAGFRNMQMLYCGKIIYIDDLSTLPAFRGKGYAGILLDYIHQLAKETGKDGVHLDSGYQRNDAHRLYLNKGYKLACHHFLREV